MNRFLVVMAFCAAIFCAAIALSFVGAAHAANEPVKKFSYDLRRGTVQGNFNNGDVRMAGTLHAPRGVKRQLARYNRGKKQYKTQRGRQQLARSLASRTKANYGNLNQ